MNAPRTRAMPSKVSAQVDTQARARIVAGGMNQLSFAVYAMKCEKSPQATPGFPNTPQKPNRSPTAERNDTPRASRKNTELKSSSRLNKPSTPYSPASFTRTRSCRAADSNRGRSWFSITLGGPKCNPSLCRLIALFASHHENGSGTIRR